MAKDPAFKASQIDYIMVSSRWATSVRASHVKWGISIQRWGRKYDHGLVYCKFRTRIRSHKRMPPKLDFSKLKSDPLVQEAFEQKVQSNLSTMRYDTSSPAESLSSLTKSINTAASAVIPKRSNLSLRRRHISSRTRELYKHRQNKFDSMSKEQMKEATRATSISARDDFRSYMNDLISDIEQADRNGNTREVTRLTKVISGKKASSSKMPSKDLVIPFSLPSN